MMETGGTTAHDLRARMALAAHTVALVVLVALLVPGRGGLFRPGDCGRAGPLPAVASEPSTDTRRAMLVVIDALRADTARDPTVMPHLSALAVSPGSGHGLSRIQTLIPSTIAGIEALATGACSPAVSFFDDFRASAVEGGGVLEAVAEAGGEVHVYGPRLWRDRYGRWIVGGYAGPALRTDDGEVLTAALAGLRRSMEGFGPFLWVVHLSGLDAAGHRHGARSPQYRDRAARADAALGRLLAEVPAGTAVLVTSDHGVTVGGGHAARESSVVETPLITQGPGLPRGTFDPVRQQDVPRLLLRALGLPSPTAETEDTVRRRPSVWVSLSVLAVAGLAAWRLLLVSGSTGAGPPFSTWAPGGFWLVVAVLLAWGPGPAWIFAVAVLAALALRAGFGRVDDRGSGALVGALAIGGLLGAWRWWDGVRAVEAEALSVPWWPVVFGSGLVALPIWVWMRRRFGRGTTGIGTGAVAVVLVVLLARWTGETASLSTLDVRPAFWLVDSLGLGPAIGAAVLRQGLPCVVVAAGLWWVRPMGLGGLAAGLGATLLGQILVPAVMWQASVGALESSMALGVLLRVAAETFYLASGLALVLSLGSHEKRPGPEGTGA